MHQYAAALWRYVVTAADVKRSPALLMANRTDDIYFYNLEWLNKCKKRKKTESIIEARSRFFFYAVWSLVFPHTNWVLKNSFQGEDVQKLTLLQWRMYRAGFFTCLHFLPFFLLNRLKNTLMSDYYNTCHNIMFK